MTVLTECHSSIGQAIFTSFGYGSANTFQVSKSDSCALIDQQQLPLDRYIAEIALAYNPEDENELDDEDDLEDPDDLDDEDDDDEFLLEDDDTYEDDEDDEEDEEDEDEEDSFDTDIDDD